MYENVDPGFTNIFIALLSYWNKRSNIIFRYFWSGIALIPRNNKKKTHTSSGGRGINGEATRALLHIFDNIINQLNDIADIFMKN
jgi:hypothetical protein